MAVRKSTAERFWSRIRIGTSDECWNASSITCYGYGQFFPERAKNVRAHRFAWELTHGPIPNRMFVSGHDGIRVVPAALCVCHRCNNRACVNPAHLYLDTQGGNTAYKVILGRQSKGKTHYAVTNPERLARGSRNGMNTCPERRPHGEQHGNHRLTEDVVRDIFRLCELGHSFASIGRRHRVSVVTIRKIRNGQAWKHLGLVV